MNNEERKERKERIRTLRDEVSRLEREVRAADEARIWACVVDLSDEEKVILSHLLSDYLTKTAADNK